MKVNAPHEITTLFTIVLIISGCAYIDSIQKDSNYRNIESSISISKLDEAEKYIGKAPLSRAYEFSFLNAQNESFSLLFTIHENSFPQSTLQYRRDNELLRHAFRIDEKKSILVSLDKNLPKTNQIIWINIGELPSDEAMDNYSVMLEYIRFKIRDS